MIEALWNAIFTGYAIYIAVALVVLTGCAIAAVPDLIDALVERVYRAFRPNADNDSVMRLQGAVFDQLVISATLAGGIAFICIAGLVLP
ncbi:hypothetical protein [Roseovarius atlanticus]|uniref:hypothetical protein n=1 Tax=Roseovarius atlanticus TaxID=1641875 RepID=UPI001C94DF7E|nr:hypothetical protein [Roseovarius atlanticus]MBY5987092.1 hypothetical protein [Roseovarius atlanticus]MBY6125732.1 hypothetical protein [Roseovarius atlanticus]MBY6149807.1 hypothetical protein [Roseovarius atlanticus]